MSISDGHWVGLTVDPTKLISGLNKARRQMDGSLGRMSSRLNKFATKIEKFGPSLTATLASAIGSAALGSALLKAASDAEEGAAKFRAVFKDQSVEVEKWASDQALAYGRAKSSIMDYLASLQDTFVPLGFARQEAAGLSKGLTQLAMDLGSFYNIAEKDAIQSLTSALVGNHESVRKFGVVITQATIKQELLNMGLKGGVKGATEQQKTLARLGILLKSTADAQGNAARESAGYASKLRETQDAFKQLAETAGANFLPIATAVLSKVTAMTHSFDGMSDEVKTGAVALAGIVVVGPLVVGALTAVIGALIRTTAVTILLSKRLVPVTVAVATVAAVYGELTRKVDESNKPLEKSTGIWDAIKRGWADGKKGANALNKELSVTTRVQQNIKKGFTDASEAVKKLTGIDLSLKGTAQDLLGELGTLTKKLTGATNGQNVAMATAEEKAQKAIAAYKKLSEAITGMAGSSGGVVSPEQEEKLNAMRARMTDPDKWRVRVKMTVAGREHLRELEAHLARVKQFTASIGDTFSSHFLRAMDTITRGGKLSFKDLAISILADLQRILLKALILKPIMNSLGLGGGGMGGGGGLGQLLGSFLPKFHKGLTPREFPAILEKGESVLTERDTQRTMQALKGGGGGSVTNVYQTIDARGSDAGVEMRVRLALLEAEKKRPPASAAVRSDQRRHPMRG